MQERPLDRDCPGTAWSLDLTLGVAGQFEVGLIADRDRFASVVVRSRCRVTVIALLARHCQWLAGSSSRLFLLLFLSSFFWQCACMPTRAGSPHIM
jgi:hypothetical protein